MFPTGPRLADPLDLAKPVCLAIFSDFLRGPVLGPLFGPLFDGFPRNWPKSINPIYVRRKSHIFIKNDQNYQFWRTLKKPVQKVVQNMTPQKGNPSMYTFTPPKKVKLTFFTFWPFSANFGPVFNRFLPKPARTGQNRHIPYPPAKKWASINPKWSKRH